MRNQPLPEMLRTVPMFAALGAELLKQLAAMAEVSEVAAGAELCRQGALPEYLHILLAGQITLSGTAPDGAAAVVDILSPPGHFVLAAVLTQLPYLMTAQALTAVQLLRLDAAALRGLLAREPALALSMLQNQALDCRAMVRQVRDLKLRSAAQRLGCYLLAQVTDPLAHSAEFRLPFEKGLLAGRLGCRQENLSRAFAVLRTVGVETSGTRVWLHDIPRLQNYAAPDELADSMRETASGEAAQMVSRSGSSAA
ncbi:transcriptional regulator [Acidocella aquatica]|uniref:Transcriptional regulator n=1 Tax=Acidocella aquatica TaxID=1922313 RepID=A0ABQ6A984_9PROT|nr:cyclic nucleotide-binding domain-containing protein [Acidocella aquatica]GLR67873.1 transcriptional regulator [Acidocella aquatica]